MKYALATLVTTIVLAIAAPAGPPPCKTEDSLGPCTWNAQTQGNGTGRSFTVDAQQNVTYQP